MRPSHPGMVATAAGIGVALAIAACQFSYSNPAESLRAGQVSGRTVADIGVRGTMLPAAGIAVSVKGSAFDQVTHDTGRFTMIPLPAGQHTLLFRKDTNLALVRIVDVVTGPDGQPDGVSLGDVEIPFAASVGGRVDGAPAIAGGDVVDETTGLTAFVPEGGKFRMDGLSVGKHVLKFGVVDTPANQEWLGGPRRVGIEESAQSSLVPLADISVRPATTAHGHLRFRLLSLHASVTAPDILITVKERLRGALAPSSIPAPTSRGWIELDVQEGIYQVQIAAPPPYDTEVTAPAPAIGIVLAGEVADLGSLYLVPPGIPSVAQYLCVENADCGKAGPCTGSCPIGWSPQQAAPATAPLCSPQNDFCSPGPGCTAPDGSAGFCYALGGAYQVCVPCGQDCTVNGVLAYHGAC